MLSKQTILKSDTQKNIFGGILKHLANHAAEWPGFGKISQKLHRFHDNFKPICAHLADRHEGDRIVVMNHGDLWTTNFMYAYDDPKQPEKPTRAIFVSLNSQLFLCLSFHVIHLFMCCQLSGGFPS